MTHPPCVPGRATDAPPPAALSNDAVDPLLTVAGLDISAGLRQLAGNQAAYRHLLSLFLDTHRDDLSCLDRHLATGERETARRIAHSLKGAASAVGAFDLMSLAAEAEHALRDGLPEASVQDRLQALGTALARLCGQLAIALAAPAQGADHSEAGLGPLMQLLRDDDIRAGDALRTLLPTLERTLPRDVLNQLTRQVQAFDFKSALNTLAQARLPRPMP